MSLIPKKDDLVTGFICGIITPLIAFAILFGIFYLFDIAMITDGSGISTGFRYRNLSVIAICANLLPFHTFKNRMSDKSMRGVGVITILLGIAWVIYYQSELFQD